jgi:hypothetical protein
MDVKNSPSVSSAVLPAGLPAAFARRRVRERKMALDRKPERNYHPDN